MFDNLKMSDDVQQEKDVLGGAGLFESDVYDFTIKLAFVSKADSGATAINVHLQDDNNRTYREQLWVTSGTAKGCKNYYEKDGQKHYLPGFLLANALSVLSLNKPLSDLVPEEKVVPLWDKEQQKELPTKVPVIVDLIGKRISAAILKITQDKTADTGRVENGKKIYEATGETYDSNILDKFFRIGDGLTVPEINAGATQGAFKDAWIAKNKGTVKNKAKGAKTVPGGGANRPAANSAVAQRAQAAPSSLFDD